MGRKRNYDSDAESLDNGGFHNESMPAVRSRRERVVKAKLRGDDEDRTSSHTDSGSGDHYSPVNVTDVPRVPDGFCLAEGVSEGYPMDPQDGKRPPAVRKAGVRAPVKPRRKTDGTSKRTTGGIFKTAAIKILNEEAKLLSSREIYLKALGQGLVVESAGKTPESTMAAALYTDIKKKRGLSTFIKPIEGRFGLREWTHEDCNLLSDTELADVARADMESDMDSGIHISDFTPQGSVQEGDVAPPRKAVKKKTKSNKEGESKRAKEPKAPKGVQKRAKQKAQRPRSASVPPNARRRVRQHNQQPARSGPPVLMHDRLLVLCAAMDQVSGTSNTSNCSGYPSQTNTEDEENYRQSSGDEINPRLSVEPENSVHAPTSEGRDDKPEVAQLFKSEAPAPATQGAFAFVTQPAGFNTQPAGFTNQTPSFMAQPAANLMAAHTTGFVAQPAGNLMAAPTTGCVAQPAANLMAAPATGFVAQSASGFMMMQPVATVFNPLAAMPAPLQGTLEGIQPLTNLNLLPNLAEISMLEGQLRNLEADNSDSRIAHLYFQLCTLYTAVGEEGKATIAREQLSQRLEVSYASLVPEEVASSPAAEAGTPPAAEGLLRLAAWGNSPSSVDGNIPSAVEAGTN